MSIRCINGSVLVAVHNVADIRNVGHRTEIFIIIDGSSTTTIDYDSFFESVSEIFHAKESDQSNFQVNFWIFMCFRLEKRKSSNSFPVPFRRSSQQIYNVTLFFLFFMSLYGLLGVQFFGELKNHCVLNTTENE